MNLHKNSTRLLCVILAAMLTAGSVVYADDAPSQELVPGQSGAEAPAAPYQKTETVYVNLDPTGKPRQQIVTDWLHTDTPQGAIQDRTTLTDIENVKGTEQPQRQGDALTWPMQGSDLYYRGETDGQLPVEISVTYRLDGKELPPEKLAGRSGQLEMTVSVRNTQKHTVSVNGKPTTMYTPVTAAFALALPEEHFQNVSVSSGTVKSDGGSSAVAFVSMPGLSESLGLSSYDLPLLDQLDFPEEFVIRAQVTDFEMGPMGVLVSTKLDALDDLEDDTDIDAMIDDLNSLSQAQDDLENWDPDGEIRSLFRDQELTEGAQTLVRDIFSFYDTDTAILDLLPRYVTEENIRLYDRISQDLEDIDLDALTDSKALDELVDRMTGENLDDIRALLADYDTIQGLDRAKLETLLDDTLTLVQQMKRSQEQVKTLKVLASYADEMLALVQGLDDPQLTAMLTEENLKTAFTAIAKSLGEKEVQQQAGTTPTRLLQAESAMLSGNIAGYEGDVKAAIKIAAQQNPEYQKLLGLVDNYSSVHQDMMSKYTGGATPPAGGIAMLPAQPQAPAEDGEELVPGESDTQLDPVAASQPLTLTTCAAGEESGPVELADPSDSPFGWTLGEADPEDAPGEEEGDPQDGPAPEEEKDAPAEDTPAPDEEDPAASQEESTPDTKEETPAEDEATPSAEEAAPAPELFAAPQPTQPVQNDMTVCQAMVTVVDGVRVGLENQIEIKTGPEVDAMVQKMLSTLQTVEQLKAAVANDLGGDPQKKLQQAQAFVEQMVPALQKVMEEAQSLNKDHNLDQLLKDAGTMLDHLDANRGNIRALQKLLKELDDGELEDLRRHYPTLKEDLDDLRPILEDLRDDLDDPVMDASLHRAPESVGVLMEMKNDLLSNRQVSEILRQSVRPDGVPTARRMFDTFDDLQQGGSLDKYTGQANDLDQLLARKDAYLDLAEDYRIYTDAAPEAETSVAFIMKTDEIEKVEAAELAPAENTDTGLWARCKAAAAGLWKSIQELFA